MLWVISRHRSKEKSLAGKFHLDGRDNAFIRDPPILIFILRGIGQDICNGFKMECVKDGIENYRGQH